MPRAGFARAAELGHAIAATNPGKTVLADWIGPVLAAPFIGSLLGVLIRRLPAGRPVALARSECETCGATLSPVELVPLLSYAVQRGACRHCAARIAPFHWHVEAAALVVALSAVLAGIDGPALWAVCGAGWTLLALAWIDAETMLLPDALTLPLIPAGLAVVWWLDPDALTDHALAAALGYGALQGLAVVYRRLRGRDGLGEGDAKLLGAIGAWVGLANLPTVVLIAAVAGLLWAGLLHLRGAALTGATAIPFGPFLALAGWMVLLLSF